MWGWPPGCWASGSRSRLVSTRSGGALFETLAVNEYLKQQLNDGRPSNLLFWRDSKGLEIDLLLERGDDLTPVEIKSGQTIAPDFFTGLKQWLALSGAADHPAWLIYGGDREHRSGNVRIVPWSTLPPQSERIFKTRLPAVPNSLDSPDLGGFKPPPASAGSF